MMWAKLSIEVLEFSWHIISTSPGEETLKVVRKIMCQNYGELYDDDEEKHVIDGLLFCDFCRLKK